MPSSEYNNHNNNMAYMCDPVYPAIYMTILHTKLKYFVGILYD